jgi:hypothetical protein
MTGGSTTAQIAAIAVNVVVTVCSAWLYSRKTAPVEALCFSIACVSFCICPKKETLAGALSVALARLAGRSTTPVAAAPAIAFSTLCIAQNSPRSGPSGAPTAAIANPVALRSLVLQTLKTFQVNFLKTSRGDESARAALAVWDAEFDTLSGDVEAADSSDDAYVGKIEASRLTVAALSIAATLIAELVIASPGACTAAVAACCSASLLESTSKKQLTVAIGSIVSLSLSVALF